MINAHLAAALLASAVSAHAEPALREAEAQGRAIVAQSKAQAKMVRWSSDGGLAPYRRAAWMTHAGEYHFERTPEFFFRNGTAASCSASSGPAHAEVLKALADPDVAAALTLKNATFGLDQRCLDGGMRRIEVMGAVIMVGGDCPSPGERMSCQTSCANAPAGVTALAELLWALNDRMAAAVPACKAAQGF